MRSIVFQSHWTPVVIPGKGVFLLSVDQDRHLRGDLWANLVTLLDGSRCSDQIVEALRDRYDTAKVIYALLRLERGGYLAQGTVDSSSNQILWSGIVPEKGDSAKRLTAVSEQATGAKHMYGQSVDAPDQTTYSNADGGGVGAKIIGVDAETSMNVLLNLIRPLLLGHLVGREGYDRLVQVTSILPAALSELWGFEFRLNPMTPFADILFSIAKGSSGAGLLAGTRSSSLDELCHDWPIWRRLRSFAREWHTSLCPQWCHVNNLWLELDVAKANDEAGLKHAIHQPNLFFGPKKEVAADECLNLIRCLASTFDYPSEFEPFLPWFFDTLPYGARVSYVGFMFTRPMDHGLRLVISDVPQQAYRHWLVKLLPQHAADFMPQLEEISQYTRSLNFAFNLRPEGLDDTIALECFFDRRQDESRPWETLINVLKQRDKSLDESGHALDKFIRVDSAPITEVGYEDRIWLNPVRRVHHLKCTLQAESFTQVKAYLSVHRREVRLGDLAA